MEQSITEQSKEDENSPPLIYRIKEYKPKGIKELLTYMLIRPPRFLYNEQLLIPPERYQDVFKIEEFAIPFKLTLYVVKNMEYVILYLHGNSSSRFQGYMHLKELPPRVGLACFDFNGCGMRFEANYITLGKNQSKEVDLAAKFLKGKGFKVVGWGRSMGSVSLLLSQQCDIMVADSPFCSLSELCKESSSKFLPSICCCFFHCLYPCVFSCVRSDVRQKSGLDPIELEILQQISNNPRNKNRSLFLLAGTEDTMIPSSHSKRIFEAFPGRKQIQLFEGTHNSQRPSSTIKKCFVFIQKQLGLVPHPCLTEYKGKKVKLKAMQLKIAALKQHENENADEAQIKQQQNADSNSNRQNLELSTQTIIRNSPQIHRGSPKKGMEMRSEVQEIKVNVVQQQSEIILK